MARLRSLLALALLGASGLGCTMDHPAAPDAHLAGHDTGASLPETDAFVPIRHLTGLRIQPADPVIDVLDGDTTGLDLPFSAIGVYDDGSEVPATCDWSLDAYEIGDLRDFNFRPYGTQGGTTHVHCVTPEHSATTSVTVRVAHVLDTSGLSDAERATLTSATTADPAVSALLYPYDHTVFPRGLGAAPEVMWDAPSASDVYALSYVEEFASATVIFTASTPARSQLPYEVWSSLQASSDGRAPLEVTLRRLAGGSGGTAYRGPQHHWTLSSANLAGTVYYWEADAPHNTGHINRMHIGEAPSSFVTSRSGCVGCHAVARDGSMVSAGENFYGWNSGYDIGEGGARDGMERYWESQQSGYRAVSPDGAIAAFIPCSGANNYHGEPIAFTDTETGARLPTTGLESMGLTNTPSFGQGGELIAFSIRTTPNDDQQHNVFRDTDLGIAAFDPVTHVASSPRVLLTGTGVEMLGFPSFTPDDVRVAFQRGTSSRLRAASSDWAWTAEPSLSDLWIVGADGTNAVRMEQASNGGVIEADRRHSYHPIFSPAAQAGYFWVVFTSLRTYGNRLTTTADRTYNECDTDHFVSCRRPQLWVAAVDISPELDADPSHPAFWLPGQSLETSNFDGYWSFDACRPTGDGCEAGFECCEGACLHDDTGASPTGRVCGAPGVCSAEADTCESTADCCTGLICVGGVCTSDSPV